MALHFTTGVPEIDRLTQNRIESGSFVLIAGNDDEGTAAFSAAIERSIGRPAEKEIQKSGGKIFFISPENREEWKEHCSRFWIQPQTRQSRKTILETKIGEQEKADAEADMILWISDLSGLFEENVPEINSVRNEEKQLISRIREIKAEINPCDPKLHVRDGIR